MEVFDAIAKRRSIRRFTSDPVREEDLKRILAAAGLGPSAHNSQPWHFIVIREKALQDELKAAVNAVIDAASDEVNAEEAAGYQRQKFFATSAFEAPVTIAAVTWPVPSLAAGAQPLMASGLMSTAAAVAQLNLAAVDLGYGCCWSTLALSWARAKIEPMLDIEPPKTIALLLALGVPAKSPKDIIRKPVEEIVTFR